MKKGTWKNVNIPVWIFLILSCIISVYFLVPFSLAEEFNPEYTLVTRENRILFILISLFLPVFSTLISFHRFYTDKRRADKSERKKVFIANLSVSLLVTLIPYITGFFITVFNCAEFIDISQISVFFINCIICVSFILSVCVLVTTAVRTIIIQSVYIISILFLPLALESAIYHITGIMAEHLVVTDFFFLKILRGYPVFMLVKNNFNAGIINMLFYFIISVFIIKIAFDIFTKHIPIKNEGYIRYDKIKGIFRFIFFSFFAAVSLITSKTSVLILIICSLVNLLLCELILNGKLKINNGQKWYFLFLAVLIVFFCTFKFDLFHINEPEIFPDEVLSVYMGTDYDNIENLLNIAENEAVCDFENINHRKFYKLDSDKINRIINFQKNIEENDNFPYVYIGYKLRNGKFIVRKYKFDYRICI